MSNFATMNRATMLALRVCAARLDPSVTSAAFAQLVADFREAVENEAAPDPIRAGGTSSDDDDRTDNAQPVLPAAKREPAAPSQEGAGSATGGAAPAKKLRGPPATLTPETREAVRREFAAACEANGGKAPYGWQTRKARELGISDTTLWRAVSGVARSNASEGNEQARDHTHSNACWCRKGPNNAANPWCANKPTSGVPVGLRSRAQPTVRNERFSGERAVD